MARSTRTTAVLATILLAPLAASLAYGSLFRPEAPSVEVAAEAVAPAPVVPVVAAARAPEAAGAPEVAPALAPEMEEEEEEEEAAAEGPTVMTSAALLFHDRALVAATHPDLGWGQGSLKTKGIEYGYSVRRGVDVTRVPEALRAMVGQRFVVHAADGATCVASATGLSLYGEETSQAYDPDEGSVPTRAELKQLGADLGTHAFVVEAKLDARCEGVWARRADLPAPIVFRKQADDPALAARVRALVEGHPRLQTIKKGYEEYLAGFSAEERAGWDTWEKIVDRHLRSSRWDELGGSRSFINVQLTYDGGCGGPEVFMDGPTTLMLSLEGEALTVLEGEGFLDPMTVMDVDSDGILEAVTHDGRSLETRGSPGLASGYDFPAVFCPC